ncbi:MAG: DUF4838 domain-containing protein [Clostridia bacterium]|nr:DUF4838 domain-containing protein [Clostridia bacterium]
MKYDVIGFAKNELDKYLEKLGISADIELCVQPTLGGVDKPIYDDAIEICVTNKKGHIFGSNERSVLIGVYRLLEEWGIRWVRPGKNGTYYPKKCVAHDVSITEKASKRHRTMCIEGAVSLENVLDMVEWLPKAGFNGYFIQFDNAFIFFERWYSHAKNPFRDAEPFDAEKSREYVKIISDEVKKRGLMLHRMGHCWTCNPFGVICNGWDEVAPEDIPDSYIEICALVGGKRDVWKNKPLTTQLCYSKPNVRETIADAVVDYVKSNPETDVIHFWLGDYFNNYCECDECAKKTVSDHYVTMVNEITAKMEAEGLDTTVIFDCGYNTALPPIKEKLTHPQKTMLMFAPISRTFAESFPDSFKLTEATKFAHNEFTNPRSVDENLAYLCEWEKYYTGDAVDFDYHLMWDHILDAGGEGIARVIYDDIRNFENLGMNGFISCQLQRNTFPTSIAMTVMGKTLWNNDTDFDKVRRELYAASFGEDMADKMCEYFATLSRGFDIGCIRAQKPYDKDIFKTDVQNALKAMEEMKPIAKAHLSESDPCRHECWKFVLLNIELYSIIGEAILVRLDGDIEQSKEMVKSAAQIAFEKEDELQVALDCNFFEHMTRTRITPEKAIEFKDV